MSLDLGALVGSVILETTTFDRTYTRVVAQFSQLGVEAAKSAEGTTALDGGLAGVGKAADTAAVGLDRVSKSTTTTSASEDKAAAAATRHAAAVARVTETLTANSDASTQLQAAQLRQVAAQDRLDAAMASGSASAARLAGAQASLIASAERIAAVQASATAATEKAATAQAAAVAKSVAAQSKALDAAGAKFGSYASKVSKATIALSVVVAAESIKQAADFQSQITLLQTAGGETAANISTVSAGILRLATATGTSVAQLTSGMYTVEKAGDRGAAGINVLGAAAEGAKAENVDLATSVNALTSVLMSYHLTAADAVSVQNQLIAGSGMAKTTMQDYAGALSTVIPIASAAGISFAQIGGAIATLTQHGTSAQEATQELANTIRALQAPNAVAVKAMQQLGINVTDLETNLGTRGLTGTIQLVTDAIAKKLGPGGTVLVNTMMQSQTATADLQTMLGKMPANLKTLSEGFLNGTVSMSAYRTGFRSMGASGSAMGTQFMTLAQQVNGYNAQIKAGGPAAQTAAAALKNIMGGATGLNTALMLGGENMQYFVTATNAVAAAGKQTGSNISTWAKTQATLSVQLDKAKETVQVLAIQIGTKLIPVVETVLGWLTSHQKVVLTVVTALAAMAVAVTAASAAYWLFTAAQTAVSITMAVMTGNMIALDAAMDANPVGAITLAILALGVAAYEVVTHLKTVVAFLNGPWGTAIALAMLPWASFIALPMLIVGHWQLLKRLATDLVSWLTPVVRVVSGAFVQAFGYARDAVSALADTPHALMSAWSAVIGFFTRIGDDISGAFTTAWDSVYAGGQNVVQFFEKLPDQILAAVKGAASWLLGIGKDIANGLLTGFYDIWVQWPRDVYRWLVANGGLIGIGETLMKDFNQGLTIGVVAVANFFTALPGKIGRLLLNIGTWLLASGDSLMTGMWNGITTGALAVWGFFTALPGHIGRLVITAATWLLSTGRALISGLLGGIEAAAVSVWGWFTALPGRIRATTIAAGSWLVGVGLAIVHGLLAGIEEAGSLALIWFITLPIQILKYLGNAGSWLIKTGEAIMDGLITGIKHKLGELADTLKHIATSVVKGLGKALGVNSPSTVMRDKIGKMITAGIAVGMVKNVGMIDTANTHLANRVAGAKIPAPAISGMTAPIPANTAAPLPTAATYINRPAAGKTAATAAGVVQMPSTLAIYDVNNRLIGEMKMQADQRVQAGLDALHNQLIYT